MDQPNSSVACLTTEGTISFAFDIDGVLVRSANVLQGATETLLGLQDQNIPFILLTNGGGKTEEFKAQELSQKLRVPLHEDQVVLSHTPFRDFVPTYKDRNVLVVGGVENAIRNVAHTYGFNKVFTTSDLFKMENGICSLIPLTTKHHNEHGRTDGPRNESGKIEIGLILVFQSSRDMALDLQIIMELLLSTNGQIGTFSSKNGDASLPNNGYGQDNQPAICFSNQDITCAHSYHLPRIAQGSFLAALKGMWCAHTKGAEMLGVQVFGKPTNIAYTFGERALHRTNLAINGSDAPSISRTYMVGDNPASDIQGSNAFKSPKGVDWKGILVESGVFVAGTIPAFVPHATVPAVQEAVQWAMRDAAGLE